MTYSWPIYIVLAMVFTISLGTALLLPTAEILRWVSGAPALVALIGVVLQIFRDHAQHEKACDSARPATLCPWSDFAYGEHSVRPTCGFL